jgi:phospholipase/carboxylesterase
LLEEQGWTVRVQPPEEPGSGSTRSLLLVHGLKGDETVMWIFTRNLPKNYWLFAPRAPVAVETGGYTWLQRTVEGWPDLDSFRPAADKLLLAFQAWAERTGAPEAPIDVMGFSQGAALAYALAALYPRQVGRVLALAGFLPGEAELPGRYSGLRGKQVYVAHGSRDETVPVSKAQEAVRILQIAGASVTFCESDTGHKLSAGCLRGLEEFFS